MGYLDDAEASDWERLLKLDPKLCERIEFRQNPDNVTGPCWYWTGAFLVYKYKKKRYGKVKRNKKYWLVHRYVRWVLGYNLKPGNHTHHECRRTLCCNPEHTVNINPVDHQNIHAEDWSL